MNKLIQPNYLNAEVHTNMMTRVIVLDYNEDTHSFTVKGENGLTEVTGLLLPAKALPQIGEKWIIERKFGTWVFSYYIVDLTA